MLNPEEKYRIDRQHRRSRLREIVYQIVGAACSGNVGLAVDTLAEAIVNPPGPVNFEPEDRNEPS